MTKEIYMAKKRLALDVEDDLHSLLKQKAAEQGISLSLLCSRLLQDGLDASQSPQEKLGPNFGSYELLPLDKLRYEVTRLALEKPRDWEAGVRRINTEIAKRFVVK